MEPSFFEWWWLVFIILLFLTALTSQILERQSRKAKRTNQSRQDSHLEAVQWQKAFNEIQAFNAGRIRKASRKKIRVLHIERRSDDG